jgi:crotonobetainyl-CoA:carnitine CoA-transferase CaiB-like acyl-CoA transferase
MPERGRLDAGERVVKSPLSGVRVLAVEQHGAVPYATLHLADLGADVIKVEDPRTGGDIARGISAPSRDDAVFFESLNRGKRSVALDLRNAAGRATFAKLVAAADAVVANLRADVIDRLGLRFRDLEPINPRVVCCFLTGFGLDGRRRDEPGYDATVQATTGWMSQTGEPGGPPTKTGLSLVDFHAGQLVATAVASGLVGVARSGRGGEFDLSLFDAAIGALSYLGAWQLTLGYEAPRRSRSAHPVIAPVQLLRTREGWLMVGVVKVDQWDRLLACLNRRDLAEDARFADATSRARHREELELELEKTLQTRPAADWAADLVAARVPAAPVRTIAEALRDPHVIDRSLIATVTDHAGRPITCVGTPFLRHSAGVAQRAPALGEHTEQVLDECSKARRSAL